jgi:hypothetical protein
MTNTTRTSEGPPKGYTPRRRPSLTQRLVVRLMPGRADEIEQQSREWFVVCPHCGLERTYWDVGGIRYEARGQGKRIRLRCPSCRRRGTHVVEHRPGIAPS